MRIVREGTPVRRGRARRRLSLVVGAVVAVALYVGLLAGLLAILSGTDADDRGWATAGAALTLVLAGLAVWQAMRIATLTRISRALTEAAVTTPWPTGEILPTLLRLVRGHVRAARVDVTDSPTEGSLWAPLDAGRYLVVERDRGDLGFTSHDAHLVAGLASMARASLQHAERERQLQREAVTDHLTGLWSYQHWYERLTAVAAEPDAHRLGVVFLDCDGFKQLNSRYGHLDADIVLATLGARLRTLASDTAWRFCRFGGDEFAGWLPDIDQEALDQRCEELAATLADPIPLGRHARTGHPREGHARAGHTVSVTASIGRAVSPPSAPAGALSGAAVDELIEAAEIDMRRRKLRKPGAVLTQHADRNAVRRMIDAGDIAVAYQPVVRLADHQVWGCEALLRGRTGRLGLIPPPLLVESASAEHLLDAVTREVMTQALEVGEQARVVSGVPMTMTLNIEVEQFHPASALLDWLVERVDAAGVPVVLELSERDPIAWTPERDRLADELAAHGIGVGLDDLGAGADRMTLVGERCWDLVKLDRGLLLEDHDGRGPVALRHTMGILGDHAIAGSVLEGIETPEQEALARDLGIRYGQGNGLAAPMTPAAFLELAGRGLAVPPLGRGPR